MPSSNPKRVSAGKHLTDAVTKAEAKVDKIRLQIQRIQVAKKKTKNAKESPKIQGLREQLKNAKAELKNAKLNVKKQLGSLYEDRKQFRGQGGGTLNMPSQKLKDRSGLTGPLRRKLNTGGLVKKGHTDYRKKGMFK